MDDRGRRVRPLGRLRSVLFAPAVRADVLIKLPLRGADAVVVDCEDASPIGAKVDGRINASEFARDNCARCQVAVRVNAPTTAWFRDDVRQALLPELAAVAVPKVETLDDLALVDAELDEAGLRDLGVIVGIETVLGVADARQLLAHPRVVAAYFGAEDFIADIGGARTDSNDEVLVARQLLAFAGRLADVPVVDQVVTDLRDVQRLERETTEARAMGYAGKLCIHPAQVDIVNRGFAPSSDEVEQARRLLAAYRRAQDAGVAAIDFEGRLVDEAVAAQARRTIAIADGV